GPGTARNGQTMSESTPNSVDPRVNRARQGTSMAKVVRRNLGLLGVGLTAFAAAYATTRLGKGPPHPPGMVWVPGGEFTMGTDADLGWPEEKPAHRVRIDGFWM